MTWGQPVAQWFDVHGEAIITLIIGAVLSTLANWFYYRRAEKPKQLGWELVSGNRIISASDDQRQNLVVTYKDRDSERELKNPYVLVIRVRNIGKMEIKESDFTHPIAFNVTDAELIAHKLTSASSDKIKAAISEEPKPSQIHS